MEKKGRGAAFSNNKKSFPRPAKQTQSSRKFQSQEQKLSVPIKARWPISTTSSKAFAFKTKVTFHNICLEAKHVKGYFAVL